MVKKGSMLMIALIITVLIIIYVVYYHTRILSSNTPVLHMNINEARARRFGLILDVRTEKEREELGYYPNSIPLSMNKLQEIKSLTSNMSTSILVYSNGDQLAQHAANMIYKLGYHNVRYISTSYLYLMPGAK